MASLLRLPLSIAAAIQVALWRVPAFAQAFAGPSPDLGLPGGADEGSIRDVITEIIRAILNFLALIAVIVVIIAGIRLIVSQGEEEAKEKAKKTIIYALIGLIIVLFARVIVGLVTVYLAGRV
ncbi:MAG: hypothetical protein G01um101425_665 [Candidatus Peregrinibacteria bacterium Gr01-1014_25]|nr:MAG: hypothetical protein G01um101425_665 [Candidatus Peregrinibacteria bacterium Gr01-1014_25]